MAQMRALETPDPFNDDFYYHNAMRRKQEKSQREALTGQEPNARVREARGVWGRGRGGGRKRLCLFGCLPSPWGVCRPPPVEQIETRATALFLGKVCHAYACFRLG